MLNQTKMYDFVWTCDDVDTMLIKRRQKFPDGYEHLNNLLCNHVIQL